MMGFFTWDGEKKDGWEGMSRKERLRFLSTRDPDKFGMSRKEFKKAIDREKAEGKKKGFFSWD